MKKKNRLKSIVGCCFVCGKELILLQEKFSHRINPKKGNSELNLIIVCKDCKKILQKVKLSDLELDKNVLKQYFSNIDIENKKIILHKLFGV